MSVIQRNTRTIDLSAIENNMKAIRSSVPDSAKLIAVVKADGYGHGAVETALAAIKGGADMLAVAAVNEGVQLREKGIRVPVLVLGAVTASDVQEGAEYGLIQTVCSPEMVFLCEQAGEFLQKQTEVHLKIDTGMGRIGVRNEMERDAVLEALEACPHVRLTGAFTHFSDADGDDDGIAFTKDQYRQFLKLTEPLPESVLRHCCNSAAIHRFPEMALDIVRAGISLYGYPPVHTETALKPCMTWTAVISYIKDLPAGSYVSYGRTYRSNRPVRTATITCGYADGYFRACAKDGYVLIRGKRAKIVGRVCMDQMMADISDIDDARTGDEVVLLGKSGSESIDAEEIASWAGTISYEILCSSGSRVERKYISQQ